MLEDSPSNPAFQNKQSSASAEYWFTCFNGAKWIEDAIESALEQSLREFELIISDNASTDQTEAICRRFR